jgi:hypothetical protein
VARSRQASKQAGGVGALGREGARGPANAAATFAADSAQSAHPESAPRGQLQQPHGACEDGCLRAQALGLQLPVCNVQEALPGGGLHTRRLELAGGRGRRGRWCMPGWGIRLPVTPGS